MNLVMHLQRYWDGRLDWYSAVGHINEGRRRTLCGLRFNPKNRLNGHATPTAWVVALPGYSEGGHDVTCGNCVRVARARGLDLAAYHVKGRAELPRSRWHVSPKTKPRGHRRAHRGKGGGRG